MRKLDLEIDSCFSNVDIVGSCIRFLSSQVFDDMRCLHIETCVVEAVTNCIRHGYNGEAGHAVRISYQEEDTRITLVITDSGIGMNPLLLENTSTNFEFDLDDIENYPTGKWGLKIIKAWMDEVRYWSEGGFNHLLMVKYNLPPSKD